VTTHIDDKEERNMVTFNIDPARTALLVVDLQRVFVDGSPVAAPDGPAVLRRLNQLAAYCRQRGIRVIHTRHVVRPDHSNAGCWPRWSPPWRRA
jgi:biuret amidohydrolase